MDSESHHGDGLVLSMLGSEVLGWVAIRGYVWVPIRYWECDARHSAWAEGSVDGIDFIAVVDR